MTKPTVKFVTSYEVIPLADKSVPDWFKGGQGEFLCRVTRTWGNKGLPITDSKPVAVFVTDSEGDLFRELLRGLQEQGVLASHSIDPSGQTKPSSTEGALTRLQRQAVCDHEWVETGDDVYMDVQGLPDAFCKKCRARRDS